MIISVTILDHDQISQEKYYPHPDSSHPDQAFSEALRYYLEPDAKQAKQVILREDVWTDLSKPVVSNQIPNLTEEEFQRFFDWEERSYVANPSSQTIPNSQRFPHSVTVTCESCPPLCFSCEFHQPNGIAISVDSSDILSRDPQHLWSFNLPDLLMKYALLRYDRAHLNFVYHRAKTLPCVSFFHSA